MTLSYEQIEELIGHLQGTCGTATEGIQAIVGEDYDDSILTEDNWDQINNSIFLCNTCNWWCETSEMSEIENGEDTCEGCGYDMESGYEDE